MRKILFSIFIIHSTLSISAENCADLLLRRSTELKVEPRVLFVAVQKWMRQYFSEYPSKFSMGFARTYAGLNEPDNKAQDVVSFGSGPDIFTPLINFPLAENIHLVDLMTGWGSGPENVFDEILKRAQAIHPTAKLKVLRKGFTARNGLQNLNVKNSYKPFVLEVSWQQEDLGKVNKNIFLHPISFNNVLQLEVLDSYILKKKLAGVVVTGSQFPRSLLKYIYMLAPNASAILETFSDHQDQTMMLELLSAMPYFKVDLLHLETHVRFDAVDPVQSKIFKVKRIPSY